MKAHKVILVVSVQVIELNYTLATRRRITGSLSMNKSPWTDLFLKSRLYVCLSVCLSPWKPRTT